MVDVPHLDHLCDGQNDCPGGKQIICSMIEIPGTMPLCMPLGPCGSLAMLGSPIGAFVGSLTTHHITCGLMSHVRDRHA